MLWQVITVVWRVALAAKMAAVFRIAHSGAGRRLPIVTAWLTVACLRTMVLMFGPWPRHEVYSISAPLMLGLECCSVVEVFRATTKLHRFGAVASSVLATVAFLGVAASFITQGILVPEHSYGVGLAVLFERYVALALTVTLLATRILLQMTETIPVDPLALRASTILIGYSLGEFLVSGAAMATSFKIQAITGLAPVTLDLAGACLWGMWFVKAAGWFAVRPPADGMTIAAARSEANLKALRRAASAVR